MSLNRRTLQSLKAAMLFGGILGLGFGCVINLEPLEPCASGSNNKLNDDGTCECRIGYEWCDPNDDENLNCCDSDVGDETAGDGDPTGDGDGDPTGDGDGDGDPTGDGDGDGEGDGDGDTGTLPPDSCTSEEEGLFWCTHDEAMGPEGSRFFICMNGEWVEDAAFLDAECKAINWDFAYGCVDDGSQVVPICGDGSGDPCTDEDPVVCIDEDQIAYCEHGKETWDSCLVYCQEVGVGGQTFEHGECDASDPADVACFCCDAGDQGCPI